MDIGAVKRAPATLSQVTTVREPAQSSAPPVSTVLAANKAVAAIGSTQDVRIDTVDVSGATRAQEARLNALQKTIETRLDIDPTTRQVVMRSVNQDGRVVVQVPDEMSLKLRQFAVQMRAQDEAAAQMRKSYNSVA